MIDSEGNAASLSSTLGAGSGIFRGGTQLNNMLGELDVVGHGPKAPGERLPSMMTPTLVLEDGRPRLALGSAGSVRLAGAIAQVADAVLARHAGRRGDRSAAHARRRRRAPPRGRADGHAPDGLEDRALGGTQSLLRRRLGGRAPSDGTLSAAGDPRRGGHGIVVG